MSTPHASAPPHLPPFITPPGETDVLFVVTAVVVLLVAVGIGVLYFKLHALPEHMAHGAQKIQLQIVAVLTLISLFTHNHAFWIAGLLLALVPLPDFHKPVASVVRSLERLADAAVPAVTPTPPDAATTPPATPASPAPQAQPSQGA